MRLFYDIIADKRDGKVLSEEDITHFLNSYLSGDLSDYQMSSMLMAIFFNKLNDMELKVWVERMLFSGEVLDFSDITGPVVDKHSTGGVGDKISIPLAPLLAELGFSVPMISGRGLGHTGGTLDKLESIPGFSVNIPKEQFCKMVRTIGVSLIGQTPEIAPLDKKLYALRDVTATVESIPLIASSIMSKKLAEGIRGLILDIKVGNGAFMKNREQATELAKTMKAIGERFNTKVDVLFTDMNEPLGYSIGNSLEIAESINVMKGVYVPQVTELTLRMAAILLVSFKMAESIEAGEKIASAKLSSGLAAERFKKIIEMQGGNPAVVDDPGLLPKASKRKDIFANESGYINRMDALSFGKALVQLGGGRIKKEDSIDPSVGFIFSKKAGDYAKKGDLVYSIYYNEDFRLRNSLEYLARSVSFCQERAEKKNVILGVL
ncbi:MAG TPA: thymidine phosphorylase [bacterium]|nr:thymidine phosphorylase [bacterium]HPS30752.1 thymidine phosphorylase [bacterium]